MTVAAITSKINEALKPLNLTLDVPVTLNNRLTKTLGRVKFINYQNLICEPTSIEFSTSFINTATEDSINQVILHETAHYIATKLTGEHLGHDNFFREIRGKLGCSNDKTKTRVEYDNAKIKEEVPYKYTVICNTCGKAISYYSRMCPTLRNISNCTCKICHTSNLRYIQNY